MLYVNFILRKRNVLWFALITIVVIILVYSLLQIVSILHNYFEGAKTYDHLIKAIVTANTIDSSDDKTELEQAPIKVDFENLLKMNADVVGWIYCENTPINYPLLQSTDNNYYLRRMIDKNYNIAGSVFMDYRCQSDLSSLNTIIYGHNMKNDTMFGTLTDYKEQSYYDEHSILWLLTPKQNYKIDLIAGYVTPSTSDVYKDFYNQNELDKQINASVNKSTFVSGINILEVDRIVTLSTCSYEYSNARYVLIGSLKETH